MKHPGRNAPPVHQQEAIADPQWVRLSELIGGHIGLHFSSERLPDFQRGLANAAEELGFSNLADCARWLLSAQPTRRQIEVLASHLTIGETYFFREPRTFEVLATHVVPTLIADRRGADQRLRLWSAGCSSGEEAYSLAILLDRALPDYRDWHVTLLATDINPRVLQKAVSGVFGEWSFRGVPPDVKDRYFERTADRRYAVCEEIKQRVSFERLNLVDDLHASLATNTNAMDIVLCRNVLMYFTPVQIRKVVRKLRDALVSGGWLIVSPSETSQELFQEFTTVNFPGAILYQKSDAPLHAAPIPRRASFAGHLTSVPLPPPIDRPLPGRASTPLPPTETRPAPRPTALSLYEQGRYTEAVDVLLEERTGTTSRDRLSLLVRALANQGKLIAALSWCDRWIEAHRLDAAAYYLRAVVLTECGRTDEARRSFGQAVYLEPDFVLAHFALGTLARSGGRNDEAERHFANTARVLARVPPDEVLPESDGLTAGRLTETLTALTGHG